MHASMVGTILASAFFTLVSYSVGYHDGRYDGRGSKPTARFHFVLPDKVSLCEVHAGIDSACIWYTYPHAIKKETVQLKH